MWQMILRNIRYTIRDRVSFIMSFLSVFILIVIYKAFLGQFQIDEIKNATSLAVISDSGIKMVNFWLVAGLTIVSSVTSVMSVFGVAVDDTENAKLDEYFWLKNARYRVHFGYMLSAWLLGVVVTLSSFIIAVIVFVGFSGLSNLGLETIMKLIGLIMVFNLLAVLFVFPFVRLLKSRNGFSTLSTIVGTLIGFVSGVYIAIGNVSGFVASLMKFFPFVHEGALLKWLVMRPDETSFFAKYPVSAMTTYDKTYGNIIYMNGHELSMTQNMEYVLLWIVGLFIVNLLVIRLDRRNSSR